MNRMIVAVPFGFIAGGVIGLLIGGLWLQWQTGANMNAGHPFILLTDFPGWRAIGQDPWRGAWTITLVSASVLALAAAGFSFTHRLTAYGQAHFQSRSEVRRHGLMAPLGAGLVFGKFGKPGKKRGRFISGAYDKFPHALIAAPTRSGKGVGYVIPNTLLFPGSCVVMDVKGEIFEATSRHRQAEGDQVFRFAPFDFEHHSHRYNPLERIAAIQNTDRRFTELGKLASYFLLPKNEHGGASDFITAGRSLFVAAGMLAIERGKPTIGEITRILLASGDKEKAYANAAAEVRHPQSSDIFLNFSGYSDRTLSSYASVLDGAGLGLWMNPRIDKVTSGNDFSWDAIRRRPHAVYIVANSDDIPTLAPLLRLLFGELIATMRDHVPDPATEPWPVQIILDEFDQLGHMPIVVQALKQLAGHGARVSIITQSIPGLESIYSENERLSIESAAGMKLYIAPNEKKTAAEVSEALGKTTKLAVSDSYSAAGQGLLKRSISRRNEERPLLTPDEVRKLDPDKVILIPERQNPIMADRIIYYQDAVFRAIYDAQKGPLPYPDTVRIELDELHATVNALREAKISYLPMDRTRADTENTTGSARLAHSVAEEEHQARLERAADAEPDGGPASSEAGEIDVTPPTSDPDTSSDTPDTVTHDQPPMFAKRVADDWHADGDGRDDEALTEAIKPKVAASQVKLSAFDARMNSKTKAA